MPERSTPEFDADRSGLGPAGRMLWPRSTSDLTDTTMCPACQAQLFSAVCPDCGLDLRHPAAAAVLAASTEAATALDRRAALIRSIRIDGVVGRPAAGTLLAPGAAPTFDETLRPVEDEPEPETGPGPVPVPAPLAEARPQPERPNRPDAAALPSRRKRSSVQILLLVVGVSLVAVAAIFFLTVAWLVAGLEVRSIIVAVFTVSALMTAAVLGRRGLGATAEGIAALAVILVLLDAWAIRANNLAGLASPDAALYWGVALLTSAALFLGWHALSRLRGASIAGFVVAPPGLGLLLAGLASTQPTETRLYLLCLGTAVGALIYRFTRRRDGMVRPASDRAFERMILLALAGLALVGAVLAAAGVAPDSVQGPLWTFGGVALVAALHAVQTVTGERPGEGVKVFALGTASLAALAAAVVAPTVAERSGDTVLALTAPILSAVLLALVLEFVLRRLPVGLPRTALVLAAVTAMVIAVGAAFSVVGFAGSPLADALFTGIGQGGDPVTSPGPHNFWALGALAGVGALAALFWAIGGILRRRLVTVAWLALVVVLFAVPFAGSLWLVVGAFLVLGALALVALLLAGTGRLRLGRYRPVVIALLAAAETFGYLTSWASSDCWWTGTISAVLVLFIARLLLMRQNGAAGRGALLAGAILLALVGAAAAGWALSLGANPSTTALLVNVVSSLALATAVLQLALALAWRPVFSETERRWAFWSLLGPTVFVFLVPVATTLGTLSPGERANLLQPEPVAGIAHAAILLAAAVVWVLAGTNRENRATLHRERLVAAIALAPVLLALVWSVFRATDAPATGQAVAVPAAALIVSVAALVFGTVHARGRLRVGLEIGVALILVPALTQAAGFDRPLGWLTLVLAGVVALIVAIAPDGVFASHSPRRHLGWLALLLGTAGLWLGLSRAGADALEAYLLPVALALLVAAALIRRFGRVDRALLASPVAAVLVFAGLFVAIVPLALAGQTGSLWRPIAVGTVAAVLLLGSSTIRWTRPWAAYLAAAALAGVVGVFLTAAARVVRILAEPGGPDARLEAWLLPAALVIVIAGVLTIVRVGRAGDRGPLSPVVRIRVGHGLLNAAVVGILVAEVSALSFGPLAAVRVILFVWTLSALHLGVFWLDPSWLGRQVSWVAIGSAAALVLAGYGIAAPDPIEIVSVPLAIALLASGWLHLDATPTARSWPWLAPGVLMLLVPSLLLDLTDSPLWRVVGLGVLAIVVVVLGAARRLQAPFLIGSVVLLAHALAQLWPWISLAYGAAPWWLWLGIGGVLLIVLAARYEQRIKNLKSVALMVGSLR